MFFGIILTVGWAEARSPTNRGLFMTLIVGLRASAQPTIISTQQAAEN